MSSALAQTLELGQLDPAGSRHMGRRSSVELGDEQVIVGRADGGVVAFETATLAPAWSVDGTEAVVSIARVGDLIVAGSRGRRGLVRAVAVEDGTVAWDYETAGDIGEPQKPSRFFLPFVVDIVSTAERVYVAARRYERDGENRQFRSIVYAFDPTGRIEWTYETDASPISLAATAERVAVAYNRCPGTHQHGLVVLDAATGRERYMWDPGTNGDRRVGDVAMAGERVVLASHGDYRGYCLGADGRDEWRVDLARPVEIDDDTVYAYPNHVAADRDGIVFVTGNTYPEAGRETTARHPAEHTAIGLSMAGERRWSRSLGGFSNELAVDSGRVLVPSAQHFRSRDPATHGLRVLSVEEGALASIELAGIGTAASLRAGTYAGIEEPVRYHDEGVARGEYRLHVGSIPG